MAALEVHLALRPFARPSPPPLPASEPDTTLSILRIALQSALFEPPSNPIIVFNIIQRMSSRGGKLAPEVNR